jgi:SAM-dependent methyltransferase
MRASPPASRSTRSPGRAPDVDRGEIRKLAALEDTHWWYRERRHLLARQIRAMRPGRALDIGAAAGGNTRVLREHGWDATALEYDADGARIARERDLSVVRADALSLPFPDAGFDLVVAYDVLEHISDDGGAVEEICRVLRPGAAALVAVPRSSGWGSRARGRSAGTRDRSEVGVRPRAAPAVTSAGSRRPRRGAGGRRCGASGGSTTGPRPACPRSPTSGPRAPRRRRRDAGTWPSCTSDRSPRGDPAGRRRS